MATKLFDLNIEEILDNWEVHHAIREVIANALDEQLISKSAEIRIFKDRKGDWHIRDFGRGIRIEHFTLNEDEEKLRYDSGVIGKFGVGLKDALATFSRHKVKVIILSKYGQFDLRESVKHGFDNIVTLHIEYKDIPIEMEGTDVVISGIRDDDMSKAKSLFMLFSNEEVIETTAYGQIIKNEENLGRVYINGVLASEESNFLFSYNITSLTEAMRKRLNRERLNVGRTTYTDRVKTILKSAESEVVQDLLADQVEKRSRGTQCDEMQWLDISQLAFNYFHKRRQVAYVTEQEIYSRPEVIDNIRRDGITPIIVSDAQKVKIDRQVETGGEQLRTVEKYVEDFNQSFQYKFVDVSELSSAERKVFDLTPRLFDLMGADRFLVPQVKISETMRLTSGDTSGVWDSQLKAIVILRQQLSNPESFAGTLLHELTHALSFTVDVTREFEIALTMYLGKVAITALRRSGLKI